MSETSYQPALFDHPSLFVLGENGQSTNQVDFNQLQPLVDQRFVVANRHPELPYTIYNYADSAVKLVGTAQDKIIDHCRGLIVDDDGLVVARPFVRMEELGANDELPGGSRTVFEKIDGSMGVQYSGPNGELLMSSRGSFVGSHALVGTEMLQQYADYPFDPNLTYVWEMVFPERKITVDYKNRKNITLLGSFVTATGVEKTLPDASEVPFPVVKTFEGEDFENASAMRALDWPNAEGFVVRIDSGEHEGERFKVKFPSYRWMSMERRGEIPNYIRKKLVEGKSPSRIIGFVPPNARPMMARQMEAYRAELGDALEPIIAKLNGEGVELSPKQQHVMNAMLNAGHREGASLLVRPPKTSNTRQAKT